MWDAVGVGYQPQQWRYAIILTPQAQMTQYPKIWYNCLRLLLYAYRKHINVLKHFLYV